MERLLKLMFLRPQTLFWGHKSKDCAVAFSSTVTCRRRLYNNQQKQKQNGSPKPRGTDLKECCLHNVWEHQKIWITWSQSGKMISVP